VGASGLIGHTFIASQAKNDGYTLGVLSSNFWADSIQRAEGKWSYKDIDPVAFYNAEPLGWVVLTAGPHGKSSLADLVATARNRPGELTAAMSEGSPTSYLLVQVQKASGTRFNPVPFQGGKQAITNLLGGHIDVSYGYLGEYQALMKEGRVRPIAFTAARRTTVLPDIPTFNELLSTNDILWDAFRFVAAPKGVPADRKAWLEAIMQAVIADPALKTEVEARGGSIDPTLDTPAKLAQEIERRVNSERVYYDTKAGISR
jgi:tripartite-type tricarboxylate transporter receptor subunit TctC